MPKEMFVECIVFDGMFSDEAVIELGDQSYIVPKNTVRNASNGRGEVRVGVFTRGTQEWIVLPTNYSDTIARSAGMELVA